MARTLPTQTDPPPPPFPTCDVFEDPLDLTFYVEEDAVALVRLVGYLFNPPTASGQAEARGFRDVVRKIAALAEAGVIPDRFRTKLYRESTLRNLEDHINSNLCVPLLDRSIPVFESVGATSPVLGFTHDFYRVWEWIDGLYRRAGRGWDGRRTKV